MAALLTYLGIGLVLDWSEATRDFDPIELCNHLARQTPGGSVDLTEFHYPIVAAAMALIIATSMLIGWLALRRYDPKRQVE